MVYKITIKEVGRDDVIVSYYSGDISEQGLIEFYGLDHDDVEWYQIEEE